MTNAVAVREPSALDKIREGLVEKREDIESVLPQAAGLTFDRLFGVAIEGLTRQPQLLQCTSASVIRAVYQAAELGLEPTGLLGAAYLVPFRNKKSGKLEAQLIVGYKGLIELADRTAGIHIEAEAVYDGEEFSRRRVGGRTVVDHTTRMDVVRTDDKITDVYAIAHFPDGYQQSVPMSRAEVEVIRKKYSKGGNDSAWVSAWGPMAKKTAIRQLGTKLPLRVQRLFDTAFGREDALAGFAIPAVPPERASKTVKVREQLAAKVKERRSPKESSLALGAEEGQDVGAASPAPASANQEGEPSQGSGSPAAGAASGAHTPEAAPAQTVFSKDEVDSVIEASFRAADEGPDPLWPEGTR